MIVVYYFNEPVQLIVPERLLPDCKAKKLGEIDGVELYQASDDKYGVVEAFRLRGDKLCYKTQHTAPSRVGIEEFTSFIEDVKGLEGDPFRWWGWVQGFMTCGRAYWALLHYPNEGEASFALVFQGKRGQLGAHRLGWMPELKGVHRCVVYTTHPQSVVGWKLTDDAVQPPIDVVELPKPEGWMSPEEWAAQGGFGHQSSPGEETPG